jgi:peptidyl-prolyl cis-trans isomerase C
MKRTTMILAALAAAPLVAFAQGAANDKDAKADAKAPAKAPAKAAPIAKVNGVAVPKARLDMMMLQQAGRGMPDNEQTRSLVREELVNREIIAQEAVRAGIAKVPEVQTQLELTRQEVIVGAYVRDWVRKHPITETDIEKEYDKIKKEAPPNEYKARHILVDSEDQAKDLIGQLKKGAKFDELASKNSKDTGTKDRGGDLDWNMPGVFDKQFSDAMVKLEKGKFTETPVQTRFGYHVIQLDDVRAVKVPSLAELKPRIQQQLGQQKVENLVRGLRAKAKVE